MKAYFFCAVLSTLFFSCYKIASTNPFDPECPKELFTPSELIASQNNGGVTLNWKATSSNISGFKITRTPNSGSSLLVTLSKKSIEFVDTSAVIGRNYTYSIVAFAGSNESSSITTQFTPTIVLKTGTPTSIFSKTAILSGELIAATGITFTLVGIKYEELNNGGGNMVQIAGRIGAFNEKVSTLKPNTTYKCKAYAIRNNNTYIYGDEKFFTTSSSSFATSTTVGPLATTSSYAIFSSAIIDDGGSNILEKGFVYSTTPLPTVNDKKISTLIAIDSFSLMLTGLNPLTTYYVRSYTRNTLGVGYGNQLSFTSKSRTINTGSVSDIDGNSYKTVTIGTQIWMAENLKTTKYRDGTSIPNVTDHVIWNSIKTDAMCWYNNSISNKPIYGGVYNWYVANSDQVCPSGWHIPTASEWETLTVYLGGDSVAGGKLKETGTNHWYSPNSEAVNSSGFSALPGGKRFDDFTTSYFGWLGYVAIFWSSTEVPVLQSARSFSLSFDNGKLSNSTTYSVKDGHSLRCVAD